MIAAWIACAAIAAIDPPASAASPDERNEYEVAAASAGKDADAHVRLALWCESRGWDVEKAKHLAIAVIADPSHAAARGLLGMVRDDTRWTRPAGPGGRVRPGADLAVYVEKRSKAANTAEAQWKLALWCVQEGLKDQATAHAVAATRLDPRHEAAWKLLGYKNRDGRWMTDAQAAAERAEARKQEEATRKWHPLLSKWHGWIVNAHLKGQAEQGLAAVTDPRALPAILKVFGTERPSDQARLVQLLGQIEGVRASRLLAMLAFSADSAEVRRRAIETLARRDPREFVSQVIAQIRDLVKYEVKPVGGPGMTGILLVEGKEYNVRRTYSPPPVPDSTVQAMLQMESGISVPIEGLDLTTPNALLPVGPNRSLDQQILRRREMTVSNHVSEAYKAAASAEKQLEDDIAILDRQNATTRADNERAMQILYPVTNVDLGPDREAWATWWADQQGYVRDAEGSTRPKPTFDQAVPLDFTPSYAPVAHTACFAAGTPVRTDGGLRPIEALKVGDRVLSQDVTTGKLAFEPVVAVFHNPPASTWKLRLGDDTVVATGIHRFWKAGQGWVMARDLKVGDRVRTLGGTERVEAVAPLKVQKVFNLEVAHAKSYFVGDRGALVHDNSLVAPGTEAFDAPAPLAKSKARGR